MYTRCTQKIKKKLVREIKDDKLIVITQTGKFCIDINKFHQIDVEIQIHPIKISVKVFKLIQK